MLTKKCTKLKVLIFSYFTLLPFFLTAFPSNYSSIVEKILFYKNDQFKVFYGGPVDHKPAGIRWLMPACFEDESYRTRAVYEIAFINCDYTDAEDAEVLFVKVSDINIKFKNTYSRDYEIFSALLDGQYSSGKYIVVRISDVAMIVYPDIYIAERYSKTKASDKQIICQFLHDHFKTQNYFKDYYKGEMKHEIAVETNTEIVYNPILICVNCNGRKEHFYIVEKIQKDDMWQLYYIVTRQLLSNIQLTASRTHPPLVRIDSGCLSGQIYHDDACDCLEQLHEGLDQISQNTSANDLIIHIPAHDGRGFGTGPKAETEIYKRGGRGRVHSTTPLDTIAAAELLYGTNDFDLRTFDGVAYILKTMGLHRIILLTDNKIKVYTLEKHGIEVVRKKTATKKESCRVHTASKKNSDGYYDD